MGKVVEYATAEIARHKGFEGKVSAFYWTDTKGIVEEGMSMFHNGMNLSAPTQSQLQTWLRDKHGIDIDIVRDGVLHRPTTGYKVTVISLKVVIFYWNTGDVHPTYEGALERGLLKALNLIKI